MGTQTQFSTTMVVYTSVLCLIVLKMYCVSPLNNTSWAGPPRLCLLLLVNRSPPLHLLLLVDRSPLLVSPLVGGEAPSLVSPLVGV